MDDALLELLKTTGKTVPVPGKPGKVYVYSKKKNAIVETTVRRAESWSAIAAAGRAARDVLSRSAEAAYQPVQENPMSRKYDDEYFFEQYSQDPFGAQRSLPTARRNPEVMYTKNGQPYIVEMVNGRKRAKFLKRSAVAAMSNPRRKAGKRRGSPYAAAVMKRAQDIMRSKGCSMGDAMRQAWSEVRGSRAAANPYFDPTQTRSALVPADFDWTDPTMTVTALAPRARENGRRADKSVERMERRAERAAAAGREGRSERVLRRAERLAEWSERHPRRAQTLAPDEHFAAFSGASGVTVKGAGSDPFAAGNEFPVSGSAVYGPDHQWGGETSALGPTHSDYWGGGIGRMGAFNYRLGQFSTSQTSGFQPVNRRNPRKKK